MWEKIRDGLSTIEHFSNHLPRIISSFPLDQYKWDPWNKMLKYQKNKSKYHVEASTTNCYKTTYPVETYDNFLISLVFFAEKTLLLKSISHKIWWKKTKEKDQISQQTSVVCSCIIYRCTKQNKTFRDKKNKRKKIRSTERKV